MAAHNLEIHHAAPRCLLRLWDRANGSLPDRDLSPAWLEWEDEAARWSIPISVDREELHALIESSGVILEREKHRLLHASDWQRWGRRGGLSTVRRYGTSWMAALALKRWDRISAEDLANARAINVLDAIKDDREGRS